MVNRPPAKTSEAVIQGHESSEVSVRGFVTFVIGFVATAIILHLLLYWTFGVLVRMNPRADVSPLAEKPDVPEPRLQGSAIHKALDYQDLQKLREQEDQVLQGSAQANEGTGIRSMPINRAMQMIVERGLLPIRAKQNPAQGSR